MTSDAPQARAFEDVEFGEDLPTIQPDVSIGNVRRFTKAAAMSHGRFNDHEAAREAGMPAAIVPGIMSQGILVALIHRWAPNATVISVDTIFRAPLFVDSKPVAQGVVTDLDEDERRVEIDLVIQNERGETPVLGTAKIRLD